MVPDTDLKNLVTKKTTLIGIQLWEVNQMKYIREFLPPYCLFGLFEIEPMFQFFEDKSQAVDFDDEETKRLKMRSWEKGKSEEE